MDIQTLPASNEFSTLIGSLPLEMIAKLESLPKSTENAVHHFTNVLKEYLHPLYSKLDEYFRSIKSEDSVDSKIESDLVLCLSLTSKYIKMMKMVFQKELDCSEILEETRSWIIQRLKWSLQSISDAKSQQSSLLSSCLSEDGEEFVTCIDKALDTLDTIKNNFEDDSEKENMKSHGSVWKIQCTTYVFNLHSQIKDVITAAMKIYQNSLSSDQSIIIARCHVVFRELKKFLCELTSKEDFNLDTLSVKVEDIRAKETLHYPTVRLLGDVLKDAVYSLEATVNRAVLGLVLDCMIDPLPPVQNILQHIESKANHDKDLEKLLESFDVHIERVFQIGTFSISCSADKQRIFLLKKCLLTLEDLESHLIPSVLSNPSSIYSKILLQQWIKEVTSLKSLVFLIIDPIALTDLVMEKFRSQLIKMKNDKSMEMADVKYLIDLGRCMLDYINIYQTHEPLSLPNAAKVIANSNDLIKVLKECAVISSKFFTQKDSSDTSNNNKVDCNKVLKRLKLLYSILSNISQQIMEENECTIDDSNDSREETEIREDKDENIQRADKQCDGDGNKNETYMLCESNNVTLYRSTIMRQHVPKHNNLTIVKKNSLHSRHFYKKHKGDCVCHSASFFSSSSPNEDYLLANISENDKKACDNFLQLTLCEKTKPSDSYFKRNQRKSLRRTLLLNKVKGKSNVENSVASKPECADETKSFDTEVKQDSTTSDANNTDWHITEILEQLTQLSNTLSVMNNDIEKQLNDFEDKINNTHVVSIKVNSNNQFSSPKHSWSIKLTGNNENKTDDAKPIEKDVLKDNFTLNCGIDMSFGSNVPTPERLKDIHDLETKLAALKTFWKED